MLKYVIMVMVRPHLFYLRGRCLTTIKNMHISFLLDEFCHHKTYLKGVSISTIKRYKEKLSFFFRDRNINSTEDLNRNLIIKFFINGSMVRKWRPATYRTYHITLHTFFKWCVQENYLESNPMVGIELPNLPKELPKNLSKESALRILDSVKSYPYQNEFIRQRNYCIFSIFLYAGIRKSELTNLKLHHIELEKRQLIIEYGKGKRDRVIPLHYEVLPELKKYIEMRTKKKVKCPELFVGIRGGQGLTNDGLRHVVKQIKEASGITFNLHILRHTFATLMLSSGCDIYSLSKILGHSDIKTTTIYLASEKKYLRSQFMRFSLGKI